MRLKLLLERSGVSADRFARIFRALARRVKHFGSLPGRFLGQPGDLFPDLSLKLLRRALDDASGLAADCKRLVGRLRNGVHANLTGGFLSKCLLVPASRLTTGLAASRYLGEEQLGLFKSIELTAFGIKHQGCTHDLLCVEIDPITPFLDLRHGLSQ